MASTDVEYTKSGEKRYVVHWREPVDGSSREKWFRLRREAEAFEATVETDIRRGQYTDPRLGRITVEEWIGDWRESRVHLRPKTVATEDSLFRNHILPTFGRRQIGSLRRSDLRGWISRLVADGYSPATVHKVVTLFSGCLEAAADEGLIARSPAHKLDLPRIEPEEMRFLSHEEVELLASAIDPRYRALVLVGAYAGLRFEEAAGLRVNRLNLLKKRLTVAETIVEVRGRVICGPVKTTASRRTLSLPDFLATELEGHLAATGPGQDGLVFTAPRGGPLRYNHFRRRTWKPAVAASVGEPMGFHSLRHTHVALLIEQGVNIKIIQERLGHASIRTTLDTYGHLLDGLDEGAARALDAAARGVGVGLGPQAEVASLQTSP